MHYSPTTPTMGRQSCTVGKKVWGLKSGAQALPIYSCKIIDY